MAASGSSVVRRVEELGDLAQAHIQQLSEAAGEDDHFLIRASAALEKLKLLCGEDKECSRPSNLLELYTQAILDMTYFEENKLVDEDFPEDSSEKVKELIGFLSEPEILVKENNMHPKHCELLGDELLECLSWLLPLCLSRFPILGSHSFPPIAFDGVEVIIQLFSCHAGATGHSPRLPQTFSTQEHYRSILPYNFCATLGMWVSL
uniref:Uncharacterized protein n=1 Tax=Rhinolophus ferrumequinum TaxID=59479 RepID=A0A671FST3_RHIFE